MLKSYSHHSPSPASSPGLVHYAPTGASHSLPGSPVLRRTSKSKGPLAKSTQTQYSYVDAATQWSPVTKPRMGPLTAEPTHVEVEGDSGRPGPGASTKASVNIPDSIVPSPTKSLIEPESPGLKRRGSRDAVPHAISASSTIPPKRAKTGQSPPKILPPRYEKCPVEDMVVLIANMIQELIQTNDNLPLRTGVLTRFHSRTPPGISVMDYLQRLAKHATLTPPILLSMVYYMDRLCLLYPAFTINTLTVHRFLITAGTVASKGLSDAFWNNPTYARVGGIKTTELALLELDFLYRLDWKIVPNPEALVDYYRALVDRSPGYDIESDESDIIDDESGDEVSDSTEDSDSKEEVTTGATTDKKWNAWMNDVSTKQAEGSQEEKLT